MQTIWLINCYASTPATGMGGRIHYLARELAAKGHKVFVIAGRYHHLLSDAEASANAPQIEAIDGYHFVRLDMLKYRDAHDKRRVLNWFLFSWKIANLHKIISGKPNVILYSSPAPIGLWGAAQQAKRQNAKLIFDVRDIWPKTLQQLGGFSKWHPLIMLMQWIEDWAYRQCDAVSSNLPLALDHMTKRGLAKHKFTWLPNGFSADEMAFNPANSEHPTVQTISTLSQDHFVVTYLGTMGVANSLDTLIEAAGLLTNKNIKIVAVGKGPLKSQLQRQSAGNKQVVFLDPVPKMHVANVLQASDALTICWQDQQIYTYGIAAQKLPEYLYAGKPIIQAYSGKADPVQKFDAGITVPSEDPQALAQAIDMIASLDGARRRQMGCNGMMGAREVHDYQQIAKNFEQIYLNGI